MTKPTDHISCPLCLSGTCSEYLRDKRRSYGKCPVCGLVFVPASYHLSETEEKQRYDLHRNRADDAGYRAFLERLLHPMTQRCARGSTGLDFGSGPEPALGRMFEQAGFRMALFDIYYAADHAAFEREYDFITACEVLEHLREPRKELDRLWRCLKPGGTLGVMTKFLEERERFGQWYYKNDLTHVCFYARETFAWIARQWKAELRIPEKDVVLIFKP